MEKHKETKDFAAKAIEGLRLAVEKLIEEAKTKGEKIVVSRDGKPVLIDPK